MLTSQQLRQTAAQSGVRDITFVEIDVILTHLLQLFHEQGLTDHLAFKGGTFLRKMIFGPKGRLSTDLDFTCRSEIDSDDAMIRILDALEHLAVLKLWESGKAGLDFAHLCQRIESRDDYDVQDLQNLLRKDQKPELDKKIDEVCSGFRFLNNLTEMESKLVADTSRRLKKEAETLRNQLRDPS